MNTEYETLKREHAARAKLEAQLSALIAAVRWHSDRAAIAERLRVLGELWPERAELFAALADECATPMQGQPGNPSEELKAELRKAA